MSVFVERRCKAEDPRVGTPRSIGGEAARGEMVQADAVLEVSDGVLDVGVAAMSASSSRVSPSRSVMKP